MFVDTLEYSALEVDADPKSHRLPGRCLAMVSIGHSPQGHGLACGCLRIRRLPENTIAISVPAASSACALDLGVSLERDAWLVDLAGHHRCASDTLPDSNFSARAMSMYFGASVPRCSRANSSMAATCRVFSSPWLTWIGRSPSRV
jgi:hypothetical protein